MWNCERTLNQEGDITEVINDIDLEFQTGSEADRGGIAGVNIAHLKSQAGERLASLALHRLSDFELHPTGFILSGRLVETAPNGYVEQYYDHETWELSVARASVSEEELQRETPKGERG
jgi:hypothetical protein